MVLLEFVAIIINLWLVIRLCMLNPLHTNDTLHVFHPRTDNTSGLSWLTHAARTKRPPVRRLARFCQYLLTTAPIHLRLQPSHIAGKINDDADLTSRPETRAPTWASLVGSRNNVRLLGLKIKPSQECDAVKDTARK